MTEPSMASIVPATSRASGRERGPGRFAWISFSAILLALATIGLTGMLHRPAPPQGLPDDPAVEAVADLLGGRLPVAALDLRVATSIDGETGGASSADVADLPVARLAEARRRVEEARSRRRDDPRFDVLLGHLELASHRLERAERRYRAAIARAPRYGEARLGLGVAMAVRAETLGESRAGRRLRLQAIAQLAAVDEGDRFHLAALYDRALLLARAGRLREARVLAARYAELDPGSAWAAALHSRVGEPR